jgi:hypothetical protein
MKKLQIHEYAYANPSPSGIGAKNTISNGPDNGANDLLASHFWQPKRHGSTQGAADNGITLLGSIDGMSTGELNIGGHGNDGLLETGTGQNGPFDVHKMILTWNEYDWGPSLDQIKSSSVTQISIWSCHTGAGQDGADLLFAMAKRCGRAVRAGTGFLYSNDKQTWWEAGSVWQVATPTNKPNPIPAPTPHLSVQATLLFDVGGNDLPVTDIRTIEISTILGNAKAASPKTATGSGAQNLVASLFLPQALEMSAEVMALLTAQLVLTFTDGSIVNFDVFNDRLAVDNVSQTAYYLAPGLQRIYISLP